MRRINWNIGTKSDSCCLLCVLVKIMVSFNINIKERHFLSVVFNKHNSLSLLIVLLNFGDEARFIPQADPYVLKSKPKTGRMGYQIC